MGSDSDRTAAVDATDPLDELLREVAHVPPIEPEPKSRPALVRGARLGDYEVESSLGEGGMGEIYVAKDTQLGRRVALKLVRSGGSNEDKRRILREARVASAFEHPNVITIFGVGEHEGETYIAMELVKGQTLRELALRGRPTMDARIAWLLDVARALAAAHDAGIVHRDIKPDNVMVSDSGALKVLDFGIARAERSSDSTEWPTDTATRSGSFLGTPQYASPEQLRGDSVDARSDQFSWGLMAYELIASAHPYAGKSGSALVSAILTTPLPPLSVHAADAPKPLVAVIERALSKEPDERFESMHEVVDVLAPRDAAPSSALRSSKPQRSLLGVVAFVVAVAGGALYLEASGGGGAELDGTAPDDAALEPDKDDVTTQPSDPASAAALASTTAVPAATSQSSAAPSAAPTTSPTAVAAQPPATQPTRTTAAPKASAKRKPAYCDDPDLAFMPNEKGILDLKPECR